MIKQLKKVHIIKRSSAWWHGGQSLRQKLRYYPAVASTYVRYATTKRKGIRYLDVDMQFDNIIAPLTLMYYPHEVSQKILSNIDTKLNNLLDVGANIGQFAITFSRLSPKTRIDSFEPNPVSFAMLKENVKGLKNIRIFNLGVGPQKQQTLHFSRLQTGIGSLIETNSRTEATKDLETISIQTVDNVPEYTKRSDYDLIKVDVEGYEFNVIKNLKGLKTKYLFIEMSGHSRDKDATTSEVLAQIQKTFGKYEVLNISAANAKDMNFDMLLKIL